MALALPRKFKFSIPAQCQPRLPPEAMRVDAIRTRSALELIRNLGILPLSPFLFYLFLAPTKVLHRTSTHFPRPHADRTMMLI